MTCDAYQIKCPMCEAKLPTNLNLSAADTQGISIRQANSGDALTFDDAMKTYMEEYFPRITSTTYRVPASMFYDHKGDLDLKTNEDLQKNVEENITKQSSTRRSVPETIVDRLQKDAVEKIVSRFYYWGVSERKEMVILSEYKFQDYLKLIRPKQKKSKLIGDHDVLIICSNLSVAFIQVKSVTSAGAMKTKRGKLRNAWEQVLKDEIAFKLMNSDQEYLLQNLKIFKFVAFPELHDDELKSFKVCNEHKNATLTKDTLESLQSFREWIDNNFSKVFERNNDMKCRDLRLDAYKVICGRYIGLKSIVRIRTLSEATEKTTAKLRSTSKYSLLTPEQQQILTKFSRLQILIGEYGVGKSVVLLYAAQKLVESKDEVKKALVFVISCASVSHTRSMARLRKSENLNVDHLQDFLSEETGSDILVYNLVELVKYCFPDRDSYTSPLCPDLIAEMIITLTDKHPKRQVHMFLDEVPCVPSWNWQPVEDLTEKHSSLHVWISLGSGTYHSPADTHPVDVIKTVAPKGFDVKHLSRCMRMSKNNFAFYSALHEYLGDHGIKFTRSGHVVSGPMPLWYPLPDCICRPEDPFKCQCVSLRLVHTLKAIWDTLGKVKPKDISIIFRDSVQKTDTYLSTLITDACNRAMIPFKSTFQHSGECVNETNEDGSYIQITDIFSFKGCENSVVIFINPFCWPFVWNHGIGRHGWDDISAQVSRALSQTILVTWPTDEMNFFSEESIRGTIRSYSDLPKEKSESERHFATVMKQKLQEAIEIYSKDEKEDYITYLSKKGVLIKCKVELPSSPSIMTEANFDWTKVMV